MNLLSTNKSFRDLLARSTRVCDFRSGLVGTRSGEGQATSTEEESDTQ